MRRILGCAALALALGISLLPAAADEPARRDIPTLLMQAPDRYTVREPGVAEDFTYVFGPYTIPPGHDANRITLDLPLNTGFLVAVAPDLIDAADGRVFTQQEAHIHHAHWLRVTNDPDAEYYTDLGAGGLSWVFGTGEEKTQGRLTDRADVDPTGPMYGIPVDATTPQTLIYMIHNKGAAPLGVYVVLDVTFIPGTREDYARVNGRDIHPLHGTLWGQTRDATQSYPMLTASYTATNDGTAIASGGHLHPGGKKVVVANLGPGGACDADLDFDGYPGTTILNSPKFDRVDAVTPYSENYQMGATKFGWRAPIHKGDVLRQFAPYAIFDNESDPLYQAWDGRINADVSVDPALKSQMISADGIDHHWYEAMSFTGVYVDREQLPSTGAECVAANFAPELLGADTPEVQARSIEPDRYLAGATAGMINHEWYGAEEPLCGAAYGRGACGPTELEVDPGPFTDAVHVSGFLYLPGDLNMTVGGDPPMIPKVLQGDSILFVNEDAGANIRHTITSCAWPCVGRYVSNFPVPDGGPAAFDSGKIGNLDPIDGGLFTNFGSPEDDTIPLWESPTNLEPGIYSYFCRIHPFMRGAFEVVAPDA